MKRVRLLILVATLLTLAALPSAAAPAAGPCMPGTAYDPACDVNHDNAITVADIQLTAGHWNQTGTWLSDNNHNHLGQGWYGNNIPLIIEGSFAAPEDAPLKLINSAAYGNSLNIVSAYDGVFMDSVGNDAIYVASAGDDGIQIGEDNTFPNYALFVPSPGTPGTTLLPNTANATGQWALYTVDNIEAGNVFLSAQTLVAVTDGDQPLTAGDVVAAAGLADPIPGSLNRLARVRLATAEQANVVGVVNSRMALQPLPGKAGEQDLRSVSGAAQPGDYVAITVLGATQVKVQAGEAIEAGQRLTVSDTPGQARGLRTVQVEGVKVDESGPVLGVALEAPTKSLSEAERQDGLVWVLVNPQ